MIYVALIVSIIPILVYLIIGSLERSRARTISDYFIHSQEVSTADYANTSVGYALQMAAIFLFAYWGAVYGLGALWTPLFWGIGFWLLIRLLPYFMPYHTRASTMHEYLGHVFGNSKLLQRLAAVATIVGLWGTMMAEVDYTIQIYTPIVQTERNQLLLGAAFLIFGLWYIIQNGYKAEVNTERTQVPIAYTAFMAMLLLMLPSVWLYSGKVSFNIVAFVMASALILLLIGKLRLGLKTAFKDIQTFIPLGALVGLVFVVIHSYHLSPGLNQNVLNIPLSTQLSAQGFVGIISLFIANALWMPVDLSTWQRIASVRGEGLKESLEKGTWRVLFESPATWILGVVFGIAINAGGFLRLSTDPSQGLTAFATAAYKLSPLTSGTILPWLLYPLLIIASITIMLSTIHCLISAISFTAYNDLKTDGDHKSLKSARLWTVALVVAGMVIYPELRWHYSASLPTLLYGAYSAQLSLILVAILALLRKRLDKGAAAASIIAGFIGTVVSVWFAINSTNPSAAVLPPIFAVIFAVVGFLIFYRRKNDIAYKGI